MCVAVIPCAGSGSRFLNSSNTIIKQLTLINNIPIFAWSLNTFLNLSYINEVVLIVNDSTEKKIRDYNKNNFNTTKITYINGGAQRQDSVRNAIDYLKNNTKYQKVIIHDAARPFVSNEVILDLYKSLEDNKCSTAAIRVVDTIKRTNNDQVEYLDRNNCFMIQTPQGFDINTLYSAHNKALKDRLFFTDDTSLCEHYGSKVHLSNGSIINFKITYPSDFKIAQKLSQMF